MVTKYQILNIIETKYPNICMYKFTDDAFGGVEGKDQIEINLTDFTYHNDEKEEPVTVKLSDLTIEQLHEILSKLT